MIINSWAKNEKNYKELGLNLSYFFYFTTLLKGSKLELGPQTNLLLVWLVGKYFMKLSLQEASSIIDRRSEFDAKTKLGFLLQYSTRMDGKGRTYSLSMWEKFLTQQVLSCLALSFHREPEKKKLIWILLLAGIEPRPGQLV